MEDYCLKPQGPFRDFAKHITDKMSAYASSAIVDSPLLKFDSTSVQFHLLNTTRFSRKNEMPGQSWMPISNLTSHFKASDEPGIRNIKQVYRQYQMTGRGYRQKLGNSFNYG